MSEENTIWQGKMQAELPYPALETGGCNPSAVMILREDYASAASEFTASAQYIYQSILFEKEYPEIAQYLTQIAIVEMQHLKMLGELICKLGGNPKYVCREPWRASFVDYNTNCRQILKLDMEAERAAIMRYEQHCRAICDEKVRAVIRRIIADEEVHLRALQAMLQTLGC